MGLVRSFLRTGMWMNGNSCFSLEVRAISNTDNNAFKRVSCLQSG